MLEPEKVFERWQFGFRELFRMLMPGLALLVFGSPLFSPHLLRAIDPEGVGVSHSLSAFDVTVVVLLGLVWFSLQLPKRMPIYRRRVYVLHSLMLSLVDGDEFQEKPAYQFLIECVVPPSATVRIHYFASQYYMFMDVALVALTVGLVNTVTALVGTGPNWSAGPPGNLFRLGNDLAFIWLLPLGLACWASAVRFLDDIMQFSIFVVEQHRDSASALGQVARDSDTMKRYAHLFDKSKLRSVDVQPRPEAQDTSARALTPPVGADHDARNGCS